MRRIAEKIVTRWLPLVLIATGCETMAPGLGIEPNELPPGMVSVPYRQELHAVGAGEDVLWGLARGSPPSGLALSDDGVIEGTPREFGSFALMVRLESGSDAVTERINLRVDPVPLEITTTALPVGTVGTFYHVNLRTNLGGASNSSRFWWRIAEGALPPGLGLRSEWPGGPTGLEGTPSQAGTSAFTLEVVRGTTGTLDTATIRLSLRIEEPASPSTR